MFSAINTQKYDLMAFARCLYHYNLYIHIFYIQLNNPLRQIISILSVPDEGYS